MIVLPIVAPVVALTVVLRAWELQQGHLALLALILVVVDVLVIVQVLAQVVVRMDVLAVVRVHVIQIVIMAALVIVKMHAILDVRNIVQDIVMKVARECAKEDATPLVKVVVVRARELVPVCVVW